MRYPILRNADGEGSGGTNTNPGGASDNPNDNSGAGDSGGKPQVVSYETHQRLLKEKKSMAEKLSQLEAEKKLQFEQKLRENEQYKTLAEQKEAEAKDWQARFTKLDTTLNETVKLRSFMDLLPGQVPKKYWDLIDLSDVPMDQDSKEPDQSILQKKAKEFATAFPEVIQRASNVRLSNEAPRGASTRLTYEEWTKLPLAEQKARMKDVDKSTI
jgi:hypothetical protein